MEESHTGQAQIGTLKDKQSERHQDKYAHCLKYVNEVRLDLDPAAFGKLSKKRYGVYHNEKKNFVGDWDDEELNDNVRLYDLNK
jgi:hypothetical protein